MSDDIRDLYASIVRVKLRECEKVLELSWRYHVTYIKVLETIIDSQYDHNNEVMDKKQLDMEMMNRLYTADKSLQGFIQPEKQAAIKNIYHLATSKSSSNPIK